MLNNKFSLIKKIGRKSIRRNVPTNKPNIPNASTQANVIIAINTISTIELTASKILK